MRTAAVHDTGDAPAGPVADSSRPGRPSGDRTAAPRHQAQRSPGGPARSTLILAIICISYLMVILDNSIVFTGLPQIRSDMGFSDAADHGWTAPATLLPSQRAR